MNEEELRRIKETIKDEKVENLLALWLICVDEIERRMKR